MKSFKFFFNIIIISAIISCASTDGVSFSGRMVREGLRSAMQTKGFRDGGLFQKGREAAEKPSKWKAPKGYKLTKFTVDSVPMELLETETGSQKIILQLHGGAYIIGLGDGYRNLALKYCKISGGASVLSIDYRIAPEYVYPAALIDAISAWNWLIANGYKPDNILVVGDSAGGNLALALVAWWRDHNGKLPTGMVLMSPWADMAAEGESHTSNLYKDPLFGQILPENGKPVPKKLLQKPLYAGNTDLHDKYLSPVYGEFTDFPPMLIQVGTYEVLESDAANVAKKAKAVGVDVTLTRYEGMFHVFQQVQMLPESKRAWNEVTEFIQRVFTVR